MLFLLLRLEHARYVLPAEQVLEILPLVRITPMPKSPPAVAGVIDFRGEPVQVVDLSLVLLGRPAKARMSTRVIIASCRTRGDQSKPIGLLAEQATDTLRRDPADFTDSGLAAADTGHHGPVAIDEQGIIEWLKPERLLPGALHDALLGAASQT